MLKSLVFVCFEFSVHSALFLNIVVGACIIGLLEFAQITGNVLGNFVVLVPAEKVPCLVQAVYFKVLTSKGETHIL